MENILIAPVGDFMDDLFVAIRATNPQRVILLATPDKQDHAQRVKQDAEKFKIPIDIREVQGKNEWEATFEGISETKKLYPQSTLLVNASTGDRHTRCAATSAAFVNGLKAIVVDGQQTMMLPILKFSYEKMLTERKMAILDYLGTHGSATFEELARHSKMSLPLLSYHINGNLKSEGLKSLGLVMVDQAPGRNHLTLTTMGRLLLKGYVAAPQG